MVAACSSPVTLGLDSDRFGIFPSWGLSQKLSRLIGVNRARYVSLSALPIDAATAERWGLVSQVVPPAELMKTARAFAETILSNHGQMVQDYKAVIGDGFKLPLGEALLLEKVHLLDCRQTVILRFQCSNVNVSQILLFSEYALEKAM